ncbi:helix-turn-helix domain-containing protein [Rhodococcoides fascians]|uniref:helix-turn-helix domain-containing protein n=1 Tax=Rhodococcoides fascians TaxID=1828 RepID=UPI0009B80202|nr:MULTISPECIES: helix-turn-helix transcriptional regulator [Rhodococcus]OZE98180.1 XRE family transcriptional regulator [Rhodococcus sp. 15-1189-1-1a]OZF12839.1 XRE family transcriptional regulator [Rhodococcus sp. 14-2686-1-2]
MTTAAERVSGWRPTDTLENRLRLVRAEKKLSQRAAAELIGISAREWQSMEEGRAARRVDLKVAKIAEAMGVDREWLMWGGNLYAASDDAGVNNRR